MDRLLESSDRYGDRHFGYRRGRSGRRTELRIGASLEAPATPEELADPRREHLVSIYAGGAFLSLLIIVCSMAGSGVQYLAHIPSYAASSPPYPIHPPFPTFESGGALSYLELKRYNTG